MQTKKEHKLSFWQKKKRSIIKRFLIDFVNSSDSYILQHLPEQFGRKGMNISSFRRLWMQNEKINKLDPVRLHFLLSCLEDLKNIGGSIAELGVYKGSTAKILKEIFPQRKLFLFDTFEGFEKKDFENESIKKSSSNNFDDSSLEQVKNYLQDSENIVFCKGYFPDTSTLVPEEERFALVHLDADLYNPIKAGLEFFYPRTVHHGMIVIHDYSSGAWPGVKRAVDEFLEDKLEGLIRIPDKSGTVVIKRCIP